MAFSEFEAQYMERLEEEETPVGRFAHHDYTCDKEGLYKVWDKDGFVPLYNVATRLTGYQRAEVHTAIRELEEVFDTSDPDGLSYPEASKLVIDCDLYTSTRT